MGQSGHAVSEDLNASLVRYFEILLLLIPGLSLSYPVLLSVQFRSICFRVLPTSRLLL